MVLLAHGGRLVAPLPPGLEPASSSPTVKISADPALSMSHGRQPPVTHELELTLTAGSHPLHALVGPARLHPGVRQAPAGRHVYSNTPPCDSAKPQRGGMCGSRQFHAAPMGLKTVLFGLAYYKHVAPAELAAGRPTLSSATRRTGRNDCNRDSFVWLGVIIARAAFQTKSQSWLGLLKARRAELVLCRRTKSVVNASHMNCRFSFLAPLTKHSVKSPSVLGGLT
jgi:hypothetical protein